MSKAKERESLIEEAILGERVAAKALKELILNLSVDVGVSPILEEAYCNLMASLGALRKANGQEVSDEVRK
jgi:hypothetical protein